MQRLLFAMVATFPLTACVTEDPNAPGTLMREDRERAMDEALDGVDTSEFSVLE